MIALDRSVWHHGLAGHVELGEALAKDMYN